MTKINAQALVERAYREGEIPLLPNEQKAVRKMAEAQKGSHVHGRLVALTYRGVRFTMAGGVLSGPESRN